jgi:hypothetical protein
LFWFLSLFSILILSCWILFGYFLICFDFVDLQNKSQPAFANRMCTIITYLNDVPEGAGGSLSFPYVLSNGSAIPKRDWEHYTEGMSLVFVCSAS